MFIHIAYLFLEGDLREVVDGAIMSCIELARKVAKIATILEESEYQCQKRERERERLTGNGISCTHCWSNRL